MKKFFAIALVAASLTACNSGGEKKPAEDTTKTVVDTPAAPVVDTPAAPAVDTPAAPKVDTPAAKK